MAIHFQKTLLLISTLLFVQNVMPQKFSIMTYNIRYKNNTDGVNSWDLRKDNLVKQLKNLNPDILGIQEAVYDQITFINENIPEYKVTGEGRDGGIKGEFSAIFYNYNKFKLLHSGTFWLNESRTPLIKGWDAAFPRICTYAKFTEIKNGKTFYVFNTHLDHVGNEARKNSVSLIIDSIAKLNTENLPVLFCGDFNTDESDFTIQQILQKYKNTKNIAHKVNISQKGTFNGYNTTIEATNLIDYIFASSHFKVYKYQVPVNLYNNLYPSDHFPVFIKIKIKKY